MIIKWAAAIVEKWGRQELTGTGNDLILVPNGQISGTTLYPADIISYELSFYKGSGGNGENG